MRIIDLNTYLDERLNPNESQTTPEINEGFFSNVGAGFDDMKEWFKKLAVCMEQYLTKYDIKTTVKDINNFTIKFGNTYKQHHDNRNIVVDLKPYMNELIKYPVENCLLKFSTGLWMGTKVPVDIHSVADPITNHDITTDFLFDKKIQLRIIAFEKPIKLPSGLYVTDDYICKRLPREPLSKRQPNKLLILERYVDDYPKKGKFSDMENATWWTETHNEL